MNINVILEKYYSLVNWSMPIMPTFGGFIILADFFQLTLINFNLLVGLDLRVMTVLIISSGYKYRKGRKPTLALVISALYPIVKSQGYRIIGNNRFQIKFIGHCKLLALRFNRKVDHLRK